MKWIRGLEARLQGAPDAVLSISLLIIAGVLIWVALTAPATAKALALAWAILP